MDKLIFNLVDDSFSHHMSESQTDSTVAGVDSEYVKWDRNIFDKNKPTFYTNEKILTVQDKNINYGIIYESRAIIPNTYNDVENLIPKLKIMFTHNSEFLNKYSNCKWIPGGGIWVGGKYGKGVIKIHDKSKICSIVSSNKRMCDLHNFRLNVVKNVINNTKVETFGFTTGWRPIFESLEDFMFSIVIENFKDDMYFTEKILNCFATGTIPIYLGAKNIGEKFNMDGILTFETIEDLNNILPKLNKDFYLSKIKAVEDNFERVQNYKCIEDYIVKNYM